jgi:hypothetical protein
VRLRQFLLLRGHRRAVRQRVIAGEYPLAQIGVGGGVGRELAIAVEVAVGDALREGRHQVADVDDPHHAFELGSRHQLEAHAGDDPEQAIAADGQAEELAIFAAAARAQLAVAAHERERLDLADDRLQRETAAVDIGGERAAERESVGAGLLLDDAPARPALPLYGDQAVDQLRPLDAGLGFDHAALGVEGDDPLHRPRVDEHRVGGELLAAHGVPSAGHADRLARAACRRQRCRERLLRGNRHHAVDAGRVELRMDVVDQDGCGVCARGCARGECETAGGAKKLASCRHVYSCL